MKAEIPGKMFSKIILQSFSYWDDRMSDRTFYQWHKEFVDSRKLVSLIPDGEQPSTSPYNILGIKTMQKSCGTKCVSSLHR